LRQQPASPHRAGHYAGLHPEDTPFITGYEREEDDTTYSQPPARITPRSAIRYRPTTQLQAQPRKRLHWLVWVGVALFIMIVGWVALSAVGQWWQGVEDTWTYGMPRTYQTDANVGHNGRLSHFIVLNHQGEILVIELQRGHPEASKIYTVTVLPADQASVPATITFGDINGDGKVDALVHVGATEIPMYNNGAGFQSQPPSH
jgi:hypothetical protein